MKRRTAEALKIRSPKDEKLAILKAVNPETPKTGKQTRQRADGRTVRKQSFELPHELSRQLAVFCASTGRSMTSVVEEGIRLVLSEAGD